MMSQDHTLDYSAIDILIVEDDDVDVEAIKRGMRQRNLPHQIRVAAEGQAALSILRRLEKPALSSRYVILLDLNMPGMNGIQLLDELRADARLRRSVVFVLTTSDRPHDIQGAFGRNVAGYFLKSNLDGLLDALHSYLSAAVVPRIDGFAAPTGSESLASADRS